MNNFKNNLFSLHGNIIKLLRSDNAFNPIETAPSKTDKAFEPEGGDNHFENLSPDDDIFDKELASFQGE